MTKMKACLRAIFITLFLLTLPVATMADTVKLKDGHPDRHVVVKGDTLWGISAHFLEDPWRWPEIWDINPDIENPHLIYPGDVIVLDVVNGKPILKVQRQAPETARQPSGGSNIVKLTPQIRASKLDEKPIPTIPSNAIKQFLKYPRIVSQRELDESGYIVASEDGSLISGSDDKIYARGITQSDLTQYDIVRKGKVYRKKGWHGEVLGIEVLRVADARVQRFSDPSTLLVTKADREVLVGDRLMPTAYESEMSPQFLPHAPGKRVKGSIIAVLDGVSRIGQYHTVVIDLGRQNNMEKGNILAVYQSGKTVRDPVTDDWDNTVALPDERAGTLMIVEAFDRVSYALVMEADRDIRVMDTVTNP